MAETIISNNAEEVQVKIIPEKAGTAYDATKAYRLLDYIVIDNTEMYICTNVDETTNTCVGKPLTDTNYWDKCISMADIKAAAEQATTAANAAAKSANDAATAANIAKATGSANTTLWLGGERMVVPCDKAIQLLSALEMYALGCFNVTASHKAAVEAMTTIDEVLTYDYTKGYPERLKMEV